MTLARLFAPVAFLVLAACAGGGADDPPADLGDFRLGHNIVVGETAQMVPPSRSATGEEWKAVFTDEIQKRLGRYQGEGLYHLGVSVDAYALAIPGVPVVVKPKSVLVFSVTIWDNATQQKIKQEVTQLTTFERMGISGKSLIGSGLTQTRDEQMRNLARAGARAIERWLSANRDWFDPDPAIRAAARAKADEEVPAQTTRDD
jgi:hypothetical protein